jgi:uncharacterized protein (DUF488 family)
LHGLRRVSESPTLLTVGHSNHSFEHLLELLYLHDVQGVADVRSWPASRYAPWFDREPISEALQSAGVQYVFMGRELGGRPEDEQLYDAAGHVRYDGVAASDAFAAGLEKLKRGTAGLRIAAMCAEENPEHCHRRLLLARVLFEAGTAVLHIRGDGRIEEEQGFNRPGSLFEDPLPWRSTASVSQRRRPRTSSVA